ncbi:hypothetical protein HZH68_015524 [Vespula germanica]|uniref:Uncharacterized protein n=1 Tax=Vespula germanica TaxID=30212 RepID=A0A834MRM5_VESGE|nr:hypothetical protein HZH68_015524 [Vespula germanica]
MECSRNSSRHSEEIEKEEVEVKVEEEENEETKKERKKEKKKKRNRNRRRNHIEEVKCKSILFIGTTVAIGWDYNGPLAATAPRIS